MKPFFACMALFFVSLASAQTGPVQGHTFLGGKQATTQGLTSVNYLNGIVPSAQVCVYLTGTLNLATIYKDANNTPLSNCFTSNDARIATVNPGGWIFYAACSAAYDVVASGGIAPNTYPAAVTLFKQITPSGCGGGGGGGGGPTITATSPIQVNGGSGPCGSGTCAISILPGTQHSWPILSWNGTQTVNSQVFASIITAPAAVTIPASCVGTSGVTYPTAFGGSAPVATGSTAITIYDSSSSTALCTLTWGASASTATVSGAGGTIATNDTVIVYGPATPDATLANFQITLAGTTAGGSGGGGLISLTTTGTNGVATLTGSVLNIPNYTFVSRVGLSLPLYTIASSPITSSGTLTGTLNTQLANTYLAGPASGSAAVPAFRLMGSADLPLGTSLAPGALQCGSGTTCTAGVISASGGGGGFPLGSGIPQVVTGNSWGTTYNASNLIPANFLPVATTGAFGAVKPDGTTVTISGGVLSSVGTGLSGQTTNSVPLATSATASTTSSILSQTGTSSIVINGTGGKSGITIPAGTAVTGVANSVIYESDATNGYGEINENNTGASRICTAGNAVCATGAPAFSAITSGTNTTAAMVIGSGASLGVSGSGTNAATSVGGITVSGTPSSGNVLTATSSTAADWAAGGGGAWTQISRQTVSGGSTSAITFSAIPQTPYNSLFISCYGSGTVSGNMLSLNVNGDVSADYNLAYSINPSQSQANTQNNLIVSWWPYTGQSGNHAGSANIFIPEYTNTTFSKVIYSGTSGWSTGFVFMGSTGGEWQPATPAAITSLTFTLSSSGIFAATSVCTLYGIK
jgi:hypothetical protein